MDKKINRTQGRRFFEDGGASFETTGLFPYHQAKDIIEQARLQHGEGLGDQELAPISFLRKEDASEIEFEATEGVDILKLLATMVQTIGEAEITSSYADGLFLTEKDGLKIYIRPALFSQRKLPNRRKFWNLWGQQFLIRKMPLPGII